MRWSRSAPLLALLILFLSSVVSVRRAVAEMPTWIPQIHEAIGKDSRAAFVLDGSFVHTAGELQLNVTNWGLIGSQPSLDTPYSVAPSAMWPAGSGVDYLFAAGLWIGGIRSGVPLVTTGQFQNELAPTADPLDTIYEMTEGEEGGLRYPFSDGDDDGDGRVDEDPRNGYDDDRDGKVDEDFAAISNQHFRLRMRDDQAITREMFPDHEPLGIEVIQETFQWENRRLEDSVGFDIRVRNVGGEVIEQPVFGFFVDGDIGKRSGVSVAQDDMIGFYQGEVQASDRASAPISMVYMWDCDGDEGEAEGYIGFLFLGVRTVPDRRQAPTPVSIASLKVFSGHAGFDRGGDPISDAERYEALSGGVDTSRIPNSCSDANDYRFVMGFRSLPFLFPRQEIRFQMAICMGADLEDLIKNAGEMTVAYYGEWFDRDGDPETGIKGREKYVCLEDFGPPGGGNPLLSMYQDCGFCPDPINGFICPTIRERDLDKALCLWINDDCDFEAVRGAAGTCFTEEVGTGMSLPGCTGIGGREHHVYWLAESPPPPPRLRIWERSQRVHLFWDDRPEGISDRDSGLPSFESYKIWRADDWDRPLGTSIETGPGTNLWDLIAEYDIVDRFLEITPPTRPGLQPRTEWLSLGTNTGLDLIRYVPRVVREGTEEQQRFEPLAELVERILLENPELGPNDPIRYLDRNGQITDLGARYPELQGWMCCTDQTDTLQWEQFGRRFYEYVDRHALDGFLYFYSVTVGTVRYGPAPNGEVVPIGFGPAGQPQRQFSFASPISAAQTATEREMLGHDIYVVPNPATVRALEDFQSLSPNADDPTGIRVEFRNLPAARNKVSVYTLAGDLVTTLDHDGTDGSGSLAWNLVSRKGQEIVSGVYLYSVESQDPAFRRVIGRFIVIR